MNPIVVKELQQAVRSRIISKMLLLFLLLLLSAAIFVLLSSTTSVAFSNNTNLHEVGRKLFTVLISFLFGVSILFVPAYIGIRLWGERWTPTIDLLYITTMHPASIIRGKLLSGMIITLLIFSAAMPFVAVTYPMRGIDLPSAFTILIIAYCIIIIIIQAVIFFVLIPINRFFRVLLILAFLPIMHAILGGIIGLSDGMISSGIGSRMLSSRFYQETVFFFAAAFSTFWILHILSVALITPKTMNREPPLRFWTTLLWTLWGLAMFILLIMIVIS